MTDLPAGNDPPLLQVALRIRRARALRAVHFGLGSFDEACWDILLDLRVAHAGGKPLSAEAVGGDRLWRATCRWIRMLQSHGLVTGGPRTALFPETMVSLTPDGLARMDAYLGALG